MGFTLLGITQLVSDDNKLFAVNYNFLCSNKIMAAGSSTLAAVFIR